MAIHTNVGLGDFILMEKINMEEFTRNLKIRCGPVGGLSCRLYESELSYARLQPTVRLSQHRESFSCRRVELKSVR